MKKKFLLFAVFIPVLFYAHPEPGFAESFYDKVQNGAQQYDQEQFDEALNSYVDAQIESPEDPALKYNIASTHYEMRNYEEAVKGYLDVAATAQDAELEEKSLYNAGNAMYRQGKLQEAVEYYKKALELDPEDIDAKHNLEFVLDEIKKKMNEAKKTEQQQQQQQEQQEQQQEQQQEGQQEEPDLSKSGRPQEQEQQEQSEEKEQEEQKEQEQQATGAEKDENSEQTDASSMQAREMTKEEAEQWLNSIQENRDKFQKKQQVKKGRGASGSGKDW